MQGHAGPHSRIARRCGLPARVRGGLWPVGQLGLPRALEAPPPRLRTPRPPHTSAWGAGLHQKPLAITHGRDWGAVRPAPLTLVWRNQQAANRPNCSPNAAPLHTWTLKACKSHSKHLIGGFHPSTRPQAVSAHARPNRRLLRPAARPRRSISRAPRNPPPLAAASGCNPALAARRAVPPHNAHPPTRQSCPPVARRGRDLATTPPPPAPCRRRHDVAQRQHQQRQQRRLRRER